MMLLLSALLLVVPLSTASANDDQAVTRGQFFKLVVDHLKYDAANIKAELPKDISADSPYAQAAKILKDKKIVTGFGDGTFKPNEKITPAEASTIVARILAIKGDAQSALTAKYGINFENNEALTLEKAQEVISKALTSDDSALELVDKMTVAQNQQNSYQANATITMGFTMKEGTPKIPEMPASMKMNSALSFNKEKGMKQTITTKIPNPMTNEQLEMVMEQYYVPEGIFMKMPDPLTGEEQWIDMSASMPFTFKDLMKMTEDNMNVMNDLNRKYFFYRDLGMEKLNGTNHYKLAYSGKITSFKEIIDMMGTVFNEQSEAMLSSFGDLPDLEMAMTGYMWIDENTMLPTRQTIEYEMKLGGLKDEVIPFESIQYAMDFSYSNFNKVIDIVLPEEAKNAEKMPGLEELLQEPAPSEQK